MKLSYGMLINSKVHI